MSLKFKPILIVVFVLGVLALNTTLFWKSYRTVLVSRGQKPTSEKDSLAIDLDQLKQAITNLEQKSKPVFEVKEKLTPVVSPVEQELKVEILNGSGMAGAASKLAKDLEVMENLTVFSIDNTETVSPSFLKSKKTVSNETKNAVLEIIKKDYPMVNQEDLPEESEVDIVVVLGK